MLYLCKILQLEQELSKVWDEINHLCDTGIRNPTKIAFTRIKVKVNNTAQQLSRRIFTIDAKLNTVVGFSASRVAVKVAIASVLQSRIIISLDLSRKKNAKANVKNSYTLWSVIKMLLNSLTLKTVKITKRWD